MAGEFLPQGDKELLQALLYGDRTHRVTLNCANVR